MPSKYTSSELEKLLKDYESTGVVSDLGTPEEEEAAFQQQVELFKQQDLPNYSMEEQAALLAPKELELPKISQPSIMPKKALTAPPSPQDAVQAMLPTSPQSQQQPMTDVDATPPKSDLEKELEQAIATRNRLNIVGGLLNAGQTIGTAISGSRIEKADLTKDNLGEQLVKDVQVKQKLRSDQLENLLRQYQNSTMKQKVDPNSELSKATRKMAEKFGLQLDASVPAEAAKELMDDARQYQQLQETVAARRDVARENAAIRNMMFRERQDFKEMQNREQEAQRRVSNLEKTQSNYNKDKLVGKFQEQLSSADDAEALLLSNNPIADEVSKGKIARLSGEVGVLTDQDIKRFAGSTATLSKAKQAFEQAKSGKLSDENRQLMLSLVRGLKQNADQHLQKRAMEYAKQSSKRLNIDENEAYEYLRPGSAMPTEEPKQLQQETQSDRVRVQDPKTGKTGTIPRSQLEQAKAKGYKEV